MGHVATCQEPESERREHDRAEDHAPVRRGRARDAARDEQRARDVAGRDRERPGEHEQVAAERRGPVISTTPDGDDHRLSDERDRAAAEPPRPRQAPRDERGPEPGEDGQPREDRDAVHRRGSLLAERVDDREDHERHEGRHGEQRSRPGVRGRAQAAHRDERHRDEGRKHGPQHDDHERLHVLGGDARRDRARTPDHHAGDRHEDRAGDQRRARAAASRGLARRRRVGRHPTPGLRQSWKRR